MMLPQYNVLYYTYVHVLWEILAKEIKDVPVGNFN